MKTDELKTFRLACFAAVVAALLSGCTRNNGDIGDWFGTWQMTELAVDGEPLPSYQDDIFWKFQNNVIELIKVQTGLGEHGYDGRWGTWEEDGDRLLLRFDYADDKYPEETGAAGKGIYAPFPELHIRSELSK